MKLMTIRDLVPLMCKAEDYLIMLSKGRKASKKIHAKRLLQILEKPINQLTLNELNNFIEILERDYNELPKKLIQPRNNTTN